ncbi:MAG: MarR family transcriptional regulator [Clostridia bacterium]|nr:MarR family transcriptional regulator [Clostridia bacterium]
MTTRFERFMVALAGINRSWHRISTEVMEEYGLKGSYAIYLVTMPRYPDGITSAQLSEICGRNKADVSRAVSELEDKRLVERDTGDGKGRYRATIKLTEAGREAAEQVKKLANIAVEIAGMGLPEERRAMFYETMELISSNLQNLSKNGLIK